MEERTARLTILIDPRKKAVFERLCAEEDSTPSQVVRRLMRAYIESRTGKPWSPETEGDKRGRAEGYAPWASQGWGGHPFGPGAPGAGGPGCGGPGWGGPGWTRRPGPPWFLLPLLPILFVFLIFGAIGGIAHGHFFAIIPLAFLTFAILRIARLRHRWGGWRR